MSEVSELNRTLISGAPEGVDALALADLARGSECGHLHIAADEERLRSLSNYLQYFAPDVRIIKFPAWDCVPYDRVSPRSEIIGERMDSFIRLSAVGSEKEPSPWLVIATVSSALQKVPPVKTYRGMLKTLAAGDTFDMNALSVELGRLGYQRSQQVMETGEYALRGSLMDIFPPGYEDPVRIDFFGDEVETLKTFDPVTQRTEKKIKLLKIKPMSEVILSKNAIEKFRGRYRELFGAASGSDGLYESVSSGKSFPGMEHWLPLFYSKMDTIFSYAPGAAVSLDWQLQDPIKSRVDLIGEYYEGRRLVDPVSGGKKSSFETEEQVYHPVPPDLLFIGKDELFNILSQRQVFELNPFAASGKFTSEIDAGGEKGNYFASEQHSSDANVYRFLAEIISKYQSSGRNVVLSAGTEASARRLSELLSQHGLSRVISNPSYNEVLGFSKQEIGLVISPFTSGFATKNLVLIVEQDIFGERLNRSLRRKRKAAAFIADASQLTEGDLVVHFEHGIGKYNGLEAISVGGALHDCLKVLYSGSGRLFVPVENIDVLSRFGSEQSGVPLDQLGGVAWQARKSKLKERIKEMAEQLIKVSAERELKESDKYEIQGDVFNEFCSRFPFSETDDQIRAIDDVIEDLRKGRPMDRLVCGDVGFGKTEVALRAAFVAAQSGVQVAVVVPTTLLARQHYINFSERFKDSSVVVKELSRLVRSGEAARIREGIRNGRVSIVIGTHALLSNSVEFSNLGLLVVDEEQHFGVAHKERLKQLKSDIHVLTLTATPIPRTLQMALSGVRDLSLIASPPVDRLAVRTFILPYDRIVIREAIMRERYRGGQSFYVCPRVSDLEKVSRQLEDLIPEISFDIAHGQMPSRDLENVMQRFSEGKFDVLVATNIIESGLDLPRVNTIVVHRSDIFGLSQLYQLRGRVGRSNVRAYAYLTISAKQKISENARKRLSVMQTLDSLGAGFSLASHDLDIRGAGNLLGEEQSGHIREVGIELYQKMLSEAVEAARSGTHSGIEQQKEIFSPQINLEASVLIPESYVMDLGSRLSLYRKAAGLESPEEIKEFLDELLDRFGQVPKEVHNLMSVVEIKSLCRLANVERVESGPKGILLTLHKNEFPNPQGLVEFISTNQAFVRVRPDHKILIDQSWDESDLRIHGVKELLSNLADLAS